MKNVKDEVVVAIVRHQDLVVFATNCVRYPRCSTTRFKSSYPRAHREGVLEGCHVRLIDYVVRETVPEL